MGLHVRYTCPNFVAYQTKQNFVLFWITKFTAFSILERKRKLQLLLPCLAILIQSLILLQK